MATTHVADPHQVDDDPDAHPNREKHYVIIALILAGLTVVEVLTYTSPRCFGGHDGTVIVPALLILMAIKFWMVVGFFMHLRFDKRILTVAFYSGLFLAVAVFVAVMLAMRFWGPRSTTSSSPPASPSRPSDLIGRRHPAAPGPATTRAVRDPRIGPPRLTPNGSVRRRPQPVGVPAPPRGVAAGRFGPGPRHLRQPVIAPKVPASRSATAPPSPAARRASSSPAWWCCGWPRTGRCTTSPRSTCTRCTCSSTSC